MKTMTYLTNTSFLTAGIELEFHNKRGQYRSVDQWRTLLTDAGFDWIQVKYDGSANVDVEIVFPPMPAHGAGGALDDIRAVMQFIETNGGKVSKKGCGLHVHIGNRAVKDISPAYYWTHSKGTMASRNGYFMPIDDQRHDVMPMALVKDVLIRYANQQNDVDLLLAPSRRENGCQARFCHSIRRIADNGRNRNEFNNATSANELNQILGRKFASVSLNTWARLGTIEFRQHQATLEIAKLEAWCLLIDAMFRHSDANRIDYSASRTVETSTLEQPYRNGSRIGIMWETIRRDGGATVSEISNVTGWDASTIRARVSEMRSQHGDDAIICHNQQAYGHSYGTSQGNHDLNGYEAIQSVTRTIEGEAALLPENRLGIASIFAGLDDQTFEYLNSRRNALN